MCTTRSGRNQITIQERLNGQTLGRRRWRVVISYYLLIIRAERRQLASMKALMLANMHLFFIYFALDVKICYGKLIFQKPRSMRYKSEFTCGIDRKKARRVLDAVDWNKEGCWSQKLGCIEQLCASIHLQHTINQPDRCTFGEQFMMHSFYMIIWMEWYTIAEALAAQQNGHLDMKKIVSTTQLVLLGRKKIRSKKWETLNAVTAL